MITMNENLRKTIIATGGLLIGWGLAIVIIAKTEPRHEHHWSSWSNVSTNLVYYGWNAHLSQWQSRTCTNCNIVTFELHK